MQTIFSGKSISGSVLCFGELLLRICPDTDGTWLQQQTLPFYVGGSEANVATALALWQVPTAYFSCAPNNLMGHQLAQYLTAKGLDVSRMRFEGERLGLYFLPKGSELKHVSVIYDRAHSSFSELKPGMVNWDDALKDISWLHFSAITPAINQSLATVCKEAAEAATKKGIIVSLDMNYRSKLWQWGEIPVHVMSEIVPFCDLLMGNIWAAEKLLGITVEQEKIKSGKKENYTAHAFKTSQKIMQQFPNVKAVANTFRFDQQQNAVQYFATLFDAQSFSTSAEYNIQHIVDKVGTGDCFMAGLIYGLLKKLSSQQTLDFATAAAVKKLSEAGDAIGSTAAEIEKTILHE